MMNLTRNGGHGLMFLVAPTQGFGVWNIMAKGPAKLLKCRPKVVSVGAIYRLKNKL